MFKQEESFWKKKGFYLSVSTALICVMAIGTVYYKMNSKGNAEDKSELAQIEQQVPGETVKDTEENTDVVSVGKNIAPSTETPVNNVDTDIDKRENKEISKVTKNKKSKENSDNKSKETTTVMKTNEGDKFDAEKGLLWPVKGDIILKYSENNTVFFKTLAEYKSNPAIVIASKEGTEVKAAADGTVVDIGENDEYGKTLTVDIGSDYKIIYGQIDNISVSKGQQIKEGDVIAKIAKPTKYYSEEGDNMYFQVEEKGAFVDPMLLLR